jgi:archaellum component FlaC
MTKIIIPEYYEILFGLLEQSEKEVDELMQAYDDIRHELMKLKEEYEGMIKRMSGEEEE